MTDNRTSADVIETLQACRDQFAFYAREHAAAGKHEKAATNQRFADLASATLATQPAEPEEPTKRVADLIEQLSALTFDELAYVRLTEPAKALLGMLASPQGAAGSGEGV